MNAGLAVKRVVQGQAHETIPADLRNLPVPVGSLRFGAFQLDLGEQQLFKDGVRVKVQGKVYQALMALIETPGEVVTRQALRARLWPRDTKLNYDANVNTTVNKLRQVLGDTNEQSEYIQTIPRKGYSFVARVDCVAAQPVAASQTGSARKQRDAVSSFAGPARFFRSAARIWFAAGVVALVVAAVLLGAAITLYSHRPDRAGSEAPGPASRTADPR